MSELKTFDEIIDELISSTKMPYQIAILLELKEREKAEAIKWVKDCPCDDLEDPCEACQRTIKMNNITEDDLK